MSLEDAVNRYGPIVDGKWTDESKWCVNLKITDEIRGHWYNPMNKGPVYHIYCNRDMADPLLRALGNIQSRGLLSELKTFDGCYEVRDVRGEPGRPSCHSYGLAIDINAGENPLGGPIQMSLSLVQCFKDEGFNWGGSFNRVDGMHFSRAWE